MVVVVGEEFGVAGGGMGGWVGGGGWAERSLGRLEGAWVDGWVVVVGGEEFGVVGGRMGWWWWLERSLGWLEGAWGVWLVGEEFGGG